MTISKENLDIATNLVGEWAFGGTPVHERLIKAIAQSLHQSRLDALEEAAKVAETCLGAQSFGEVGDMIAKAIRKNEI